MQSRKNSCKYLHSLVYGECAHGPVAVAVASDLLYAGKYLCESRCCPVITANSSNTNQRLSPVPREKCYLANRVKERENDL